MRSLRSLTTSFVFAVQLLTLCCHDVIADGSGGGDAFSGVADGPALYNSAVGAAGFDLGSAHQSSNGNVSEQIDPHKGGLKLVYQDYVFPGRGGMDITITRVYQSLQNALTSDSASAETAAVSSATGGKDYMGAGWALHFGRIWVNDKKSMMGWTGDRIPALGPDLGSCNYFGSQNAAAQKNPVLELADGSRQVLYDGTIALADSGLAKADFITAEHWFGRCMLPEEDATGDGGLVIYSPQGLKYVFNKYGALAHFQPGYYSHDLMYGPTTKYGYVVTSISDLHGNSINITYEEDATTHILRVASLSRNDGGSLAFEYRDSELLAITGMGGVAINYTHSGNLLQGVSIAGELQWAYEYYPAGGDGGYSLKKVTSPTGKTTEYEYSKTKYIPSIGGAIPPVGTRNGLWSVGVSKKTVDGTLMVKEVTDYTYQPAGPGGNDITTAEVNSGGGIGGGDSGIDRFIGATITYEHVGYAATSPNLFGINQNMWKRGTLVKKTINPSVGQSQEEEFLYERKAYVSARNTWQPYPNQVQTTTWKPLLTQQIIRRGGISHTSSYNYRPGSAYLAADVSAGGTVILAITNPVEEVVESGPSGSVTRDLIWADAFINQYTANHGGVLGGLWVSQAGMALTDQNGIEFKSVKEFGPTGLVTGFWDNGRRTTYSHTSFGDVESITNQAGEVTTMSGHIAAVPGRIINVDGKTIDRVIDSRGNITSEAITWNGSSYTIGRTYDDINRVKTVTLPGSASVGITYTNNHREVNVTRTGGYTEQQIYDAAGNLRTQTVNGVVTTFGYDNLGNRTYASEANGGTTRGVKTEYDFYGQTEKVDGLGTVATYSYGGTTSVSVARVVDGLGSFVDSLTYKVYGSPDEKILVGSTTGTGSGADLVTVFERYASGRLESVTQNGINHRFTYHDVFKNDVISESRPDIEIAYCLDALGRHRRTAKGAAGLGLSGEWCGSGPAGTSQQRVTHYADGNVKTMQYGSDPDETKFTYNAFGKVSTAVRTGESWSFGYDGRGNLTSEAVTRSGTTRTTGYSWNALDHLLSITYPNAKTLTYSPDVFGRPTQALYDGVNLASGVDYWPNGQLKNYTVGGIAGNWGQTAAGLPLPSSISKGAVLSLGYAYDGAGNTTDITATGDSAALARSGFQYDGASRLKHVNVAGVPHAYSYNASGDIESMSIGGQSCTYSYDGTSKRLASISGGASSCRQRAYHLGYDNSSNVISTNNGTDTFSYNQAGQIATLNGQSYAAYDIQGKRYSSYNTYTTDSGSEKRFFTSLYAQSALLLSEVDDIASTTNDNYRNYVYLGGQLIAAIDECFTDSGKPTGVNNALGVCQNADDDGDQLSFKQEIAAGTEPFKADTDGDTLNDGAEIAQTLDPLKKDTDGDAVNDNLDWRPLDPAEALDMDGDGTGNNADADDDGDGVADSTDHFPFNSSASLDTDGDGKPDSCNGTCTGLVADDDDDGDGYLDTNDSQPLDATVSGHDEDGDGVDSAVDNCQAVSNANQANIDGALDSEGDACDSDIDNDGISNADDLEPEDPLLGGYLDETFGQNGILRTIIGEYFWKVIGLTILRDEKILAVGGGHYSGSIDPITNQLAPSSYYANLDIVMQRLTSDGQIDYGFSEQGHIRNTYRVNKMDYARDILLQDDGKFIVAVEGAKSTESFDLVRYNVNGTRDMTFGVSGMASYTFTGCTGMHQVVVAYQLRNDKILVAGSSCYNASMVMFSKDGQLDGSFGSGGAVILDSTKDAVSAVLEQDDGKILLGGGGGGSSDDGFLSRINADGSVDYSFAISGTLDFNDKGHVSSLAIDNAGRFFLSTNKLFSARVLPSGSLDSAFGGGGVINLYAINSRVYCSITDFLGYYSNERCSFALPQDNGKYLIVSTRGVFLLDSSGVPDVGFSEDGYWEIPSSFLGGLQVYSVIQKRNGQILVGSLQGAFARISIAPDSDGDGYRNNVDVFPLDNSEWQDDDGDGIGNNTDPDANGDGQPDDFDQDGWRDSVDNCYLISNASQLDTDNDGLGDPCDSDKDGDSVVDDTPDNCPLQPNTNQDDRDGDAQGDVCDADDDNDGVSDAADNCPLDANPAQKDMDADSQGDVCDADIDGDGVTHNADPIPDNAAVYSYLDFSFNGTGVQSIVYTTGNQDKVTAVMGLPDKRVLVAVQDGRATNIKLILRRYTSNGLLDTSFATAGESASPLGTATTSPKGINAMLQLDDGRVVVAGYDTHSQTGSQKDFMLARYLPNGQLDTTFGKVVSGNVRTGYVYTPIRLYDEAAALTRQADGKIVAVGSAWTTTSSSSSDFAIARYNEDGSLDTASFGNNDSDGIAGVVVVDFGLGLEDQARAVLPLANGKLLVAGWSSGLHGTVYNLDFALLRLNSNGSLDTGFGTDGKFTADFEDGLNSGSNILAALSHGSNGEVWAAGLVSPKVGSTLVKKPALIKLSNINDALAPTPIQQSPISDVYYAAGVSLGGGNENRLQLSLLRQADNKWLVGGYSTTDFLLVRYLNDGTLDTSFNGGGYLQSSVTTGDDTLTSLAMQKDGRLLAGGFSSASGKPGIIARYWLGADSDKDGIADSNDSYLNDADADADLVIDGQDNCLMLYNPYVAAGAGQPDQTDTDHDGVGDACDVDDDGDYVADVADAADNCSLTANANQLNTDGDVQGDACDPDMDNDQVDNALDNCPLHVNTNQLNLDGDTQGDVCDDDDDGDGVADIVDPYPYSALVSNYLDVAGFGAGGVAISNIGQSGNAAAVTTDVARAIVASSTNKLLVAAGNGADFSLLRYTASGVLDTTYDGDGKAFININVTDTPYAMLRQQHTDGVGGAFIAGSSLPSGSNNNFSIARLNNADAVQTTRMDAVHATIADEINAVAELQYDGDNAGKIVGAGYSGATTAADFAIRRYTATGALDTTFGASGVVTVDIDGTATHEDSALAVIELESGKLLVVGYTKPGTYTDVAIVRLESNGTLDTTFGTSGKLVLALPGGFSDSLQALVRLHDGKIAGVGYTTTAVNTNNDALLIRFNADGTLDTTFDSDGYLFKDMTGISRHDQLLAAAVQPDGKLLVAGYAYKNSTSDSGFLLARYDVDNNRWDTHFNAGQPLVKDVGTTAIVDKANALLLQPDGRVVLAGQSGNDVALMRFHAIPDTDGDGINDVTDTDADNDGVTDADEQLHGSNPLLADTDKDGLTDREEIANGSNPALAGDSFRVHLLAHQDDLSLDARWLLAMVDAPDLNSAALTLTAAAAIPSLSQGAVQLSGGTLEYNYVAGSSDVLSVTVHDGVTTRKGLLSMRLQANNSNLADAAPLATGQLVVDNGGTHHIGGSAGDDIVLDGEGNGVMHVASGGGNDLAFFDNADMTQHNTTHFASPIGKDQVAFALVDDDLQCRLLAPHNGTVTLIDYSRDIYRHAMGIVSFEKPGEESLRSLAVDDVFIQAKTYTGGVPDAHYLDATYLLDNDIRTGAAGLYLNVDALAPLQNLTSDTPWYENNWGFANIELRPVVPWEPMQFSYRVTASEAMQGAGDGHQGRVEVIPAVSSYITGSYRNESLVGAGTAEIFAGMIGNDLYHTGDGPDTVQFYPGDGRDTIDTLVETSTGDTLQLMGGIAPATTQLVREGLDLLVQPNNADEVRVQGYFAQEQWTHPDLVPGGALNFAGITFASDGAVLWERPYITATVQNTNACSACAATNDIFTGGAGNDSVFGWAGDDVLSGGEGDDQLLGDTGNDTLIPGPGRNWIAGGAGADTYVIDAYSGITTIENFDLTTGDASGFTARDRIEFAATVDDADVQILREHKDLLIKVTDGTVTSATRVLNFFDGWSFAELEIVFTAPAPDVVWDPYCVDFTATQACINNRVLTDALLDDADPWLADDVLTGYAENSTIHGGVGSDHISTFGTDDVLYGDDGNDVLDSGDGSTDIIYGGNGNDTMNGGWGGNTLYGEAGDDKLTAMGPYGGSVLDGGTGSDVYELQDTASVSINPLADALDNGADTIRFTQSLQPVNLWMAEVGNHLRIHVVGSTHSFEVQNWDAADSQLATIAAGGCSITMSNLQALLTTAEPTDMVTYQALVNSNWVCP